MSNQTLAANAKTKTESKAKFDLYQEVTNKMLTLLENGVAPWRCPWKKYGMARNFATGHFYSGINALWMNLTPHPIPYFMTFNQVKAKGGKIRKGAKSEIVFFYKTIFKDGNGKNIDERSFDELDQQGAETQRIPCLKYYRVFNIEDIEGIEFEIPEVPLQDHTLIERCERNLDRFNDAPNRIYEDADRAYYCAETDSLNMPQIGQFETAEEYYCTLFHELIHSTGHASRLNREGVTQSHLFGSKEYSKEELIAEMGASFLCAQLGVDIPKVTQNSAAYLAGWIKALKADKKIIFKAAAAAQKATDYILKRERE